MASSVQWFLRKNCGGMHCTFQPNPFERLGKFASRIKKVSRVVPREGDCGEIPTKCDAQRRRATTGVTCGRRREGVILLGVSGRKCGIISTGTCWCNGCPTCGRIENAVLSCTLRKEMRRNFIPILLNGGVTCFRIIKKCRLASVAERNAGYFQPNLFERRCKLRLN